MGYFQINRYFYTFFNWYILSSTVTEENKREFCIKYCQGLFTLKKNQGNFNSKWSLATLTGSLCRCINKQLHRNSIKDRASLAVASWVHIWLKTDEQKTDLIRRCFGIRFVYTVVGATWVTAWQHSMVVHTIVLIPSLPKFRSQLSQPLT